ncbi:hypothetical protein FA13DRAFT_1876308 [Coprinellus micaceus]|uniref:Uncharacterized protein n=1 Tax=Coprinellus micaceus TaxID=71717 RepID=A0A4Y7T113_COPMI|nr:hypothetical protein FA13DRAFT_1876308 [Coprinellus micaceus]
MRFLRALSASWSAWALIFDPALNTGRLSATMQCESPNVQNLGFNKLYGLERGCARPPSLSTKVETRLVYASSRETGGAREDINFHVHRVRRGGEPSELPDRKPFNGRDRMLTNPKKSGAHSSDYQEIPLMIELARRGRWFINFVARVVEELSTYMELQGYPKCQQTRAQVASGGRPQFRLSADLRPDHRFTGLPGRVVACIKGLSPFNHHGGLDERPPDTTTPDHRGAQKSLRPSSITPTQIGVPSEAMASAVTNNRNITIRPLRADMPI